MDTTNIIMFAVVLAVCFIPVVVIQLSRKNKSNNQLKTLQKMAEAENSTLLDWDIWGDTSIGIDKDSKFVFYAKHKKNDERKYSIAVGDVTKCTINNRSVSSGAGNQETIMDLLIFANHEDIALEFYNSKYDGYVFSGQLQLIEKWHKAIAKAIKK